jgi:cbb3-type cytochrome oxidase maturation protein
MTRVGEQHRRRMLTYFALIAVGGLLFAVAIAGLVWLVRSGQLDDLGTPALRMLHDDPPQETPRG